MVAIPQNEIIAQLVAGDLGHTAAKGEALEQVVSRTLGLFSGVTLIHKNAEDVAGSCEIDLILSNNQHHPDGLPFLPFYIVVECKNWQAPVDTATVRAFTSKLRHMRMKFGLLVAANGVTGSQEERTACYAHIRDEFNREDLTLLVVTRAELEAQTSTEEFGALLKLKLGKFLMNMAHF